ncbi:polysaccharide lyase family 8 super-sandwich domain-containing protein [Pedobacter africanus]|uniref:Por secretion system C-terminal sorting domain-containing protein n=1 Tax=Pedobacter africanus TaxID=151894 RepID=A0A1W2DD83_9SPHI|nr:polysaccharide lyase family 8 super-sandwich domain-containing protein [Pedobacter africanus]SMC95046.1 Por secretion system C-terminal sorting domain-containing protein [Pedobacter africanus]
MRTLFIGLMVLLGTVGARSQQRFVSFDAGIPSNWQTNADSALAASTEHIKAGKSLKWHAKNGKYILATNLAIPKASLDTAASAIARMFIHVPAPSNDTLLFEFMDGSGNVQRSGKMLLNYKGWREFHRSYYYDYSAGSPTPGFLLNEMKITYKPANIADSCLIYIDEVTLIGNKDVRIPGPHVWPDYPQFAKQVTNAPYLNVLENWKSGPDLPVVAATAQELADMQMLRAHFARNSDSVTAAVLTAAKNYVLACNISYHTDGNIRGNGLLKIYDPATLVLISGHCSSLARAANKGDTDAKDKLVLFTAYLISEGLAEGGRIVLQTNSYTNPRIFPVGFLEALPHYTPALRAEVLKMLKWANEYSVIYGADFMEGYSVDYLKLRTAFLFELAVLDPDDNVAVRELKMVKRFMERNTVPSLGGRDGVKPDGVGYHHGSQHTSYMGAWATWIGLADLLKGTAYKIDLAAYRHMGMALKYLLMGSSKGVLFAHAESGRNPFPAALPVSLTDFEKFVEIGGDIQHLPADPEMGAIYNDVTGTNKYSVPAIATTGFHQYNYGALGILRKSKWTAVMRGFTSKIFGAEIYKNENRYGRYQSYGSLEILYSGTLAATGYILNGKGWDWNVMPGTTTVHFPTFSGLQPSKDTAMEFQNLNFAGSLSLGDDGIFGFNFAEMANGNYLPSRLRFKKTVFAFDSILVCLGSNINAIDGRGNVATNLFQGINKTLNPAIYVNSATAVTADYDQTLDTQLAGIWLVNGQSTGYYVPRGNGTVRVFRGSQSTPKETVMDQSLPNSFETALASKAWINHGVNPIESSYQFVAVPATTPQAMQALAAQIEANTVYQVLKQSDTMHVVKYLPKLVTSYAFYKASNTVNIGFVKSISDVSLLGIKENGDTLTVTMNSPDMNVKKETAYDYYWRAYPRPVSLVLNGNWDVLENPSNVSFSAQTNSVTLSFNLEHGFSKTLKLVKRTSLHFSGATQPVGSIQELSKINSGLSLKRKLKIFPNPANRDMEVEYEAADAGTADMQIVNVLGHTVLSKKVQIKKGLNSSPVNVAALVPGTYVVILANGFMQQKGIFVKY